MYGAAPIVSMPLYKEAPAAALPPPWACNRTVCAAQEWDALAARDEIDGRALDEIATLDVTQLNLLNVARAGVLVGVSALRLRRALHPDEVYLFAYLLGNLPNLERLVFEGDLDEMEMCAAEIMLHVNLRHNPLLASITVTFGHPHRSQTSAGVKRPPVKLRQPQSWIALLALRWPQGAVSLEHRIYAQGPRNGTRVYGPWKATLHPLPMLSPTHDLATGEPLGEGDERSPFVGRMHVLKFFREQDLRPSGGAKGGRRAHRRVPKDRVVVCATTFTDFEGAEEFLRDNASDDDDDLDDDIESDDDLDSDEGYDTDDVDLMDVDDEPFGGSSLHTPEEYF